MSVVKKKPATIAESRRLLEEEGEELSPLQRRVLDYTIRFSKLGSEDAVKLVDELVEEASLEPGIAVQTANCMPRSLEEIRTILGRQRIISEERLKRILEIVERHGA